MRTVIDLPEAQLEALKKLEQQQNVSRADLVGQAVAEYVVKHVSTTDALGAWKTAQPKLDGLDHQRALRDDWDKA